MSRLQTKSKKRPKFKPLPVTLLPMSYAKPPRELEMVFNTTEGELERGRSNRPNDNVVFLY